MPRTLINLDPEDKAWLDREARAQHVPMTELVRQAVRDYRIRHQSLAQPSLQTALKRTVGLWRVATGWLTSAACATSGRRRFEIFAGLQHRLVSTPHIRGTRPCLATPTSEH